MSKFHDVLMPIADLLDKKNTDYGSSFDQQRTEFGQVSFVIRIMDKINRVKQLDKSEALVKDESRIDTIKDIVGYCALELAYLQEDEKPEQRKCEYTHKECSNMRCEFDLAYKAECRDNYFCYLSQRNEYAKSLCGKCAHIGTNHFGKCKPSESVVACSGFEPKEDK
jgi:hypothetical protein